VSLLRVRFVKLTVKFSLPENSTSLRPCTLMFLKIRDVESRDDWISVVGTLGKWELSSSYVNSGSPGMLLKLREVASPF
jgi:hypothetical protein